MTATTDESASPVYGRGHWWNIKLGDRWGDVASDDLTLDEVERLETLTEVPWARANPLASLRQAKAWLLVAALHAGATEDEAAGHLAQLNLGGIKGAFQLHTGERVPRLVELVAGEVPPVPPSSAPTSAIG
jgi:hypothetical protein